VVAALPQKPSRITLGGTANFPDAGNATSAMISQRTVCKDMRIGMGIPKASTAPAFGLLLITALLALCPLLAAPGAPHTPYVDPKQLEVPWPKHSFVKIPWRAFLETKSGDDFLRGIGINYNVPGKSEQAFRLLAEAGFKTFRFETGWGSVHWDEDRLQEEDRLRWFLAQCRVHGIRPTLLLNAHHGLPCPCKVTEGELAADAPQGSRHVLLTDTSAIVPGRTGISHLTGYWAAEVLITQINKDTGECVLSKPLPKALKKGQKIQLTTLKYLPFSPVGTREFEETAAGWIRYALLVCQRMAEAGIKDFDVEIWNELSFGSRFLNINNYYNPPIIQFKTRDFLNQGGHLWELAWRTVKAIKRRYPQARCLWGFSNTTFFHVSVERLPPGIDGQSYHPYGTSTRSYPRDEDYRDKPEWNVDGFTPQAEFRIPEGLAHTFIKTESLMRLLNPEARRRRPPEVKRFYHYMTEHGIAPQEAGAKDENTAWRLKTLCALRSYCLWLNKGIDVLHYFAAYDSKALGMGLLPPNLKTLSPKGTFDEVATPPLKAVRNLTRAFAGSVPLSRISALQVSVNPVGKVGIIFNGKIPLRHPDVFAFLPFQISETRYIVAVYVATYDAIKPMPEEGYRLSIWGFSTPPTRSRLYDPLTDQSSEVRMVYGKGNTVEVEVPVVDYPRLLILE
jgi:hypothetical protein